MEQKTGNPENINKTESRFFEKIGNIDKPLPWIPTKERKKSQYTNKRSRIKKQ